MRDSRVAYIERQIEIMLEIIFSSSRMPSPLNIDSNEDCLRLIELRKKISRREHCRFKIIKMIVELTNAMSLDLSFVTYYHKSSSHRLNVVKFIKNLKSIEYYWISMTYCFAIEHKVYNPPPIYSDESVHQAIRTA